MCSDSYVHFKEIDDTVIEIGAKTIMIDDSGVNIGGNPSAEGGDEDEGVQDEVQRVINVVHSHQLVQTGHTKKSFLGYFKAYLKKVCDYLAKHNPDRVEVFKKNIQKFATEKILNQFDEFTFYTGASMDPEGALALSFYPPEAVDPVFWFFKDGLKAEKV